VHHKHIPRIQLEQNILTTPVNGVDARAAKFTFEGGRRGRCQDSGKLKLDGEYAPAEYSTAQSTHDMFNLR
jgi:hypothetical protein